MEFPANLIEIVRYGSAEQCIALLFIIGCSGWLVVARVRGCFRFREPNPMRDIALLISGPVLAILLSLSRAASATMAMMAGGIDADFGLRYGLNDVLALCGAGSIGFIAGVVALALPTKSR